MATTSGPRLLIKLDDKWYNQKVMGVIGEVTRLPRDQELALKREAEELLAQDTDVYRKSLDKGMRNSEFDWIWKVLRTGSLADKLSANSLLNQDSAVHNLSALKSMLHLCQCKGKREFLLAAEHLKELLLADILPPFKLRSFAELIACMPSGRKERSRHLILSYYEDQLKHLFKEFVDTIERMSHDAVLVTKNKSIYLMYELLRSNAEQEQLLLSLLSNKLGDPCPKAAAHALHLLSKLVTTDHPAMKQVLVKEVERVLFRANISERAQYRCLCLFQGLRLSLGDQTLADKLMHIYFSFFTKSIKSGDVNNKTMSVIVSGVTRSLPYSSMGKAAVEKHLDTFYKLVHLVNTGIAIQIFTLVLHVVSTSCNRRTEDQESTQLADRFFSSIYRFLLKPELFESSTRMPMFFNLLFKTLKLDDNSCRIFAFIKRLLQISCHTSASVTAAVVYLVSEVLKNKREASLLFHSQRNSTGGAGSGRRVPVPRDSNGRKKRKSAAKLRDSDPNGKQNGVRVSEGDEYQVNGRNPAFANAEKTSVWEMHFLARHYHPSVCSFSETVARRKFIDYDGDPLNDFSIKHFLDRFVRKKPKHAEEEKDMEDNASVNSDEFEEILLKSEKHLHGDAGDVEWEDLTDEEVDADDMEEDDFFDDDDDDGMDELFDSDDELSEGEFGEEFGDEEKTDSLFAPADEVEEDGNGNLVIRKKSKQKTQPLAKKRKVVKRKVPSVKRFKRR